MDEQETYDAIEILHCELSCVAVALDIVFRMLAAGTDDRNLINARIKERRNSKGNN